VICAALAPVYEYIDEIFIYGSSAKGEDAANSDVDLLMVTDSLAYANLMAVLADAEQSLGRSINPSIYTMHQVKSKLSNNHAFLSRLTEQPKIWLKKSEDDIGAFG
jgi:predicted nucleotidyltransferase